MNKRLVVFFICLNSTFCFTSVFSQTIFLFAPGIHSPEDQAAKYCKEYTTSTGQLVHTKNYLPVMNNQVRAVNFSEITKQTEQKPFSLHQVLKPQFTLLPILYNKILQWRNAVNDKKAGIIVEETDLSAQKPFIELMQVNFAQEADVKALLEAYRNYCADFPDADMVLYGVSRGAAAAFNFMATTYNEQPIKNIKAVVLEAPFDSMEHILQSKSPLFKKYPALFDAFKKLFNAIYIRYQFDGLSPIKVVDQFPKDVPVLFITSKKDTLVPSECTENLFNALKDAGHNHTQILTLERSSHPLYIMDDTFDREAYQQRVHAFYAECGLDV